VPVNGRIPAAENVWTNRAASFTIPGRSDSYSTAGEIPLANTASALKRIRSNNRKRIRNKMVRSRTRTAVRTARNAETPDEARQATLAAISALDRAAQKGVIHRNNAARRKSRLAKRLNTLSDSK
jgi:small subunit ribosomal protein S20